MNSVLQVLWALPEVQQRYASSADSIFLSAPADPTADLPTQVGALAGLIGSCDPSPAPRQYTCCKDRHCGTCLLQSAVG